MTHVLSCRQLALSALLLFGAACGLFAAETPSSYGAPARVDTPILRLPYMKTPPTIDGVMAAGEWEDASALSGFWYDYGHADFRFMAPPQTQLNVYAAYDKENIYFAIPSPVYPKNTWLKARGRFPDVLSHPRYGILWDDHIELELRPYADVAKGFQLGLYRWDVNPINAFCDWYWSQDGGHQMRWKSDALIRSTVDGKMWTIEFAIPLKKFLQGNYDGTETDGTPLVKLPPADGTIYRAWFVRGIGGNGIFFNAFDAHQWNTTKTQLIFDSRAPSFQINNIGPIMDDMIDVTMTVKNHNTRSETVRLGFFVESAEGTIFSSYESSELRDGLLELRPGEVKQVRLKQPFPGISRDGNVLWFDVRAAGRPAKILFRTRLIHFHSMDGGAVLKTKMTVDKEATDGKVVQTELPFRERRLDAIQTLRPPRQDFAFEWTFASYTRKIWAYVDRGIHGASDEAKRAAEAKLTIRRADETGKEVAAFKAPFKGNFACVLEEVPGLIDGESYNVSLLLFDDNRRIVGEREDRPFTYRVAPWAGNDIGKDDVVWEPFTPIETAGAELRTLKHTITVGDTGLPSQIVVHPDRRDLPLEMRGEEAAMPADLLLELGRGPQLRAPMTLAATIGGAEQTAVATAPAKPSRIGKSEVVYKADVAIGPLTGSVASRIDCDGSLHCTVTYTAAKPVKVDRLELRMPVAGLVDMALAETGDGAMTGADVWECAVSQEPGVVWDCKNVEMELFYSKFVPWYWFGSADRGWSFFCDSDAGWRLDREGDSMQLVRDAAGNVDWRVFFVNHPVTLSGTHRITFSLLTHPAKPKPVDHRRHAWYYFAGRSWAAGYIVEPADLPEAYLLKRWRTAASAPRDTPDSERTSFRKDYGPFYRYGQWRNVGICAELDQIWEDKATFLFERHVRVGRRVGWWMDEYFPVAFGRSNNLAMGNGRLRDPAEIKGDELPWHSGFLTTSMRGHYKRMARVMTTNNVPNRQHTWSNNAASMVESMIWSSLLVEECGAGHRSYDIDVVTQFPNSLYRYMSKNFTGLVTTVCADTTPTTAGDDKRLDRQHFGRALLNDIGVAPAGPHGVIHHRAHAVRLLNRLEDFGFFVDTEIEKIPFWRIQDYLRFEGGDTAGLYVTAYRRPLPDGTGWHAIFVVMNESLADMARPLYLADAKRVLGGANTLSRSDVLGQAALPAELAGWWRTVTAQAAGTVLMDLETGDVVSSDDGVRYGPVHVPYHDFRVLYARHTR
jgi:hypothetical protein